MPQAVRKQLLQSIRKSLRVLAQHRRISDLPPLRALPGKQYLGARLMPESSAALLQALKTAVLPQPPLAEAQARQPLSSRNLLMQPAASFPVYPSIMEPQLPEQVRRQASMPSSTGKEASRAEREFSLKSLHQPRQMRLRMRFQPGLSRLLITAHQAMRPMVMRHHRGANTAGRMITRSVAAARGTVSSRVRSPRPEHHTQEVSQGPAASMEQDCRARRPPGPHQAEVPIRTPWTCSRGRSS